MCYDGKDRTRNEICPTPGMNPGAEGIPLPHKGTPGPRSRGIGPPKSLRRGPKGEASGWEAPAETALKHKESIPGGERGWWWENKP